MKKLLLLACVFLASTLIWAGGTQESGEKKEVTLSVLWFNDGNESEIFMNTISDYLTANPNVKIEMQLVPFGDYEKQLKLMIAGGNPPDLARITNNHVAMFQDNLVSLTDKVDNINEITA